MQHPVLSSVVLLGTVLLSACQQQAETLTLNPSKHLSESYESFQLLPENNVLPEADHLASIEAKGLMIENSQGQILASLEGHFGGADFRFLSNSLLVSAEDQLKQQVALSAYDVSTSAWSPVIYLPKTDYKIEGLCLYQDTSNSVFAFLIGEEGQGQQWLVANGDAPLVNPLFIRKMSLPLGSEYCQADDNKGVMYINEESVGIWAYPASPEADQIRYPIAMIAPFGDLQGTASGMAVADEQLFVVDNEAAQLNSYNKNADGWTLNAQWDLSDLADPENLSIRAQGDVLTMAVGDDDGVHISQVERTLTDTTAIASYPTIAAAVQTTPVPNLGDAADDPAIWVNATNPSASLIIGTDKKGGLGVYDLDGQEQQYLAVGRLNNVDIRSGFNFNGQVVDLAIASNRDHNALHLFTIAPSTGYVTDAGMLATDAEDIYGFCMFKDKQNQFYAIANDKDGRFFQYKITASSGDWQAELARTFKLASQPEGCVADDMTETLFVGEEDQAIWTLSARADANTDMVMLAKAGEHLAADIEGLALYEQGEQSYVVASSQGDNSYAVFDSHAPYQYRGSFYIGINTDKAIDGASETDGLAVTSADLGGIWSKGLLVVQDGRKRMPETNQNYKYIPWSDIAAGIGLNE